MFGDFQTLEEFKQYWQQWLGSEYDFQARVMLEAAETAKTLPDDQACQHIQDTIKILNEIVLYGSEIK